MPQQYKARYKTLVTDTKHWSLIQNTCHWYKTLVTYTKHWSLIQNTCHWYKTLVTYTKHWSLIQNTGHWYKTLVTDTKHWSLIQITDTKHWSLIQNTGHWYKTLVITSHTTDKQKKQAADKESWGGHFEGCSTAPAGGDRQTYRQTQAGIHTHERMHGWLDRHTNTQGDRQQSSGVCPWLSTVIPICTPQGSSLLMPTRWCR